VIWTYSKKFKNLAAKILEQPFAASFMSVVIHLLKSRY